MTSTSRRRHDGNKMKNKMSKEQLHLAIIKKRQCDTRALKIIECLIDNGVDQTWMLDNLQYLNRLHMDDVTEERAILKRCGYPLCDNQLKLNISQRYHISTRSNKVYDVSRRKNFCSNNCYGASNYISEQMLTSPLWLRNFKEKPHFQLLPFAGVSHKITPGDEVDVGGENIVINVNKVPEENNKPYSDQSLETAELTIANTLLNDFDQFANKEVSKTFEKSDIAVVRIKDQDPKELIRHKSALCDTLVFERDLELPKSSISKATLKKTLTPRRHAKKHSTADNFNSNWLVERIERYLQEWITLDSLSLLLGDRVEQQRKITLEMQNCKLQKKYVQLCQKVHSLQLEESEDETIDLKPLPDYGALKEEGKKIEIKVHAFFDGRTTMETPIVQLNDDSIKETDDSGVFLPSLGELEPRLLRRRIVLEKLDKVLPEMLRTLAGGEFLVDGCISNSGCGKTVQALVNTFSLSATNVVPKPAEWNLLSLVFIKLLSISEPRLRFLLATDRASKYITMILMSYNLEPNYLDRLVAVTTDLALYGNQDTSKDITALTFR